MNLLHYVAESYGVSPSRVELILHMTDDELEDELCSLDMHARLGNARAERERVFLVKEAERRLSMRHARERFLKEKYE